LAKYIAREWRESIEFGVRSAEFLQSHKIFGNIEVKKKKFRVPPSGGKLDGPILPPQGGTLNSASPFSRKTFS
jgi:hypothetical protein